MTDDDALTAALAEASAAYAARNPESARHHAAAADVLPGGNTRTVLHFEPFPLSIVRGDGCRLWDVDGHEYVDFLGEYTAGIFGHSHPAIRAAIVEALDRGLNLSGPGPGESTLAHLIAARFKSIELLRFTNSGTEANLLALAAAVAFTGRREVLVFDGGYHGGVLTFARGGSPVNVPHAFVVCPYNDVGEAARAIRSRAGRLAAILVEPMLGSAGCIPADRDFLAALRDEATDAGAVLIFDEVMTSRLSPGGRQTLLGVTPDLTTLGKYFGGGLSFGAFGGGRSIMAQFDPRRPDALPHAGTFNNNVLTMAAGAAALTRVLTVEAIEGLNARGDRLRERLNDRCRAHGAPLRFTGLGSLMNAHGTAAPVRSAPDAAAADPRIRDLLFFDLLERGCYVARRGFIALSLAIGDPECDALVDAVDAFLVNRGPLFRGKGSGAARNRFDAPSAISD